MYDKLKFIFLENMCHAKSREIPFSNISFPLAGSFPLPLVQQRSKK